MPSVVLKIEKAIRILLKIRKNGSKFLKI